VIDENGFRLNVGIMIANQEGQLFWARRFGRKAWQFPQGGIHEGETSEEALFRELHEEVGLVSEEVAILYQSKQWLTYQLPSQLIRRDTYPVCIGQKQKWFLLRLVAGEERIKLDVSDSPEFDGWQWVNYWYPLYQVVAFKREVYRQALLEFAPILMKSPESALDPFDE